MKIPAPHLLALALSAVPPQAQCAEAIEPASGPAVCLTTQMRWLHDGDRAFALIVGLVSLSITFFNAVRRERPCPKRPHENSAKAVSPEVSPGLFAMGIDLLPPLGFAVGAGTLPDPSRSARRSVTSHPKQSEAQVQEFAFATSGAFFAPNLH